VLDGVVPPRNEDGKAALGARRVPGDEHGRAIKICEGKLGQGI
jgi:hypothetical protein